MALLHSATGNTTLRLVAGALVLMGAITAVGYVVSSRLLAPGAELSEPVSATAAAVPPAAAPQPARPRSVTVAAVRGAAVKLDRAGASAPLVVGDALAADEAVRTQSAGEVELTVDQHSQLTVTPNTEVKVRELTAQVHQLRLARGRLVARYQADGDRVLRIEDQAGFAVAETRASTFSILASGTALAVATQTGKVNLRAAGEAVDVDAGQQAVAAQGQPPSAATPISAELLLKVARLGAPKGVLCAVIDGEVEPGAVVAIDGEDVPVDAAGRFKVSVPRRGGAGSTLLAVRDVMGRTHEQTLPCEVAPSVTKLELLWGADAG